MSIPEAHDQGQLPHCVAFAVARVAARRVRFKYENFAIKDDVLIDYMEAVLQKTPQNQVALFCDEWNKSGSLVPDSRRTRKVSLLLNPRRLDSFDDAFKNKDTLVVVVALEMPNGLTDNHAMAALPDSLTQESAPYIALQNTWGDQAMADFAWWENRQREGQRGTIEGPQDGTVLEAWSIDVKIDLMFEGSASAPSVGGPKTSKAFERQQSVLRTKQLLEGMEKEEEQEGNELEGASTSTLPAAAASGPAPLWTPQAADEPPPSSQAAPPMLNSGAPGLTQTGRAEGSDASSTLGAQVAAPTWRSRLTGLYEKLASNPVVNTVATHVVDVCMQKCADYAAAEALRAGRCSDTLEGAMREPTRRGAEDLMGAEDFSRSADNLEAMRELFEDFRARGETAMRERGAEDFRASRRSADNLETAIRERVAENFRASRRSAMGAEDLRASRRGAEDFRARRRSAD